PAAVAKAEIEIAARKELRLFIVEPPFGNVSVEHRRTSLLREKFFDFGTVRTGGPSVPGNCDGRGRIGEMCSLQRCRAMRQGCRKSPDMRVARTIGVHRLDLETRDHRFAFPAQPQAATVFASADNHAFG